MFEKELTFFIENQNDLVVRYQGRVLLLKDGGVAGDYESPLAAYLAGSEKFAPGSFMIQPCEPGPDAYTVTINSSFLA